MALTTLAAVQAALMPPVYFSKLANTAGLNWTGMTDVSVGDTPIAEPTPTASLNGAALTSKVGCFLFNNPVSGNTYLANYDAAGSTAGNEGVNHYTLCDRLWENAGVGATGMSVTSTSLQSITFPTLPSRDRNGSNSGEGLYLAAEVGGNMGNVGSSITVTYTNSGNVGSRTASCGALVSTFKGAWTTLQLDAGDTGIKSVDSVQFGSSYVSGTLRLVLYRPICSFQIGTARAPDVYDALSLNFPRLYDDSTLFCVRRGQQGVSAQHIGTIVYAQG